MLCDLLYFERLHTFSPSAPSDNFVDCMIRKLSLVTCTCSFAVEHSCKTSGRVGGKCRSLGCWLSSKIWGRLSLNGRLAIPLQYATLCAKQREPSAHLSFALKTLIREPPSRKGFKSDSRHNPRTSVFCSMTSTKMMMTTRMMMRSSKMSRNSASVNTPEVSDTYMQLCTTSLGLWTCAVRVDLLGMFVDALMFCLGNVWL